MRVNQKNGIHRTMTRGAHLHMANCGTPPHRAERTDFSLLDGQFTVQISPRKSYTMTHTPALAWGWGVAFGLLWLALDRRHPMTYLEKALPCCAHAIWLQKVLHVCCVFMLDMSEIL